MLLLQAEQQDQEEENATVTTCHVGSWALPSRADPPGPRILAPETRAQFGVTEEQGDERHADGR